MRRFGGCDDSNDNVLLFVQMRRLVFGHAMGCLKPITKLNVTTFGHTSTDDTFEKSIYRIVFDEATSFGEFEFGFGINIQNQISKKVRFRSDAAKIFLGFRVNVRVTQ